VYDPQEVLEKEVLEELVLVLWRRTVLIEMETMQNRESRERGGKAA